MKPLFTLLLFCFFVINSAQKSAPDSLLSVLNKTKDPDKITKLQNQISEAYQAYDPNEMQKYASLALKTARKNNKKILEAKAFQNIGVYYIILNLLRIRLRKSLSRSIHQPILQIR